MDMWIVYSFEKIVFVCFMIVIFLIFRSQGSKSLRKLLLVYVFVAFSDFFL